MIQPDPIIVETVDRLLEEQCSADVINAAEDGQWPASLWQSLEDSGATQAWVPEAAGGGGATVADGFALLGRHHCVTYYGCLFEIFHSHSSPVQEPSGGVGCVCFQLDWCLWDT